MKGKMILVAGMAVLYWGFNKYKKTSALPAKPAVQTQAEKDFAAQFNDNPLF